MNWRRVTIINAAIALVTVNAVIFDLTRPRPQHQAAEVAEKSSAANNHTAVAERRPNPLDGVEDFSNIRVDDLGAVAAAELCQIMGRATPAELNALALKFNNLPVDGHTLGGLGVFFQAWTELDPKAALIGAFRLRDITLRKLAASTVVNSVSPSAAPQLAAMLRDSPDQDLINECKNVFMVNLAGQWALLDPEAASKFIEDLGDAKSGLNYRAGLKIAYAWGTLDPEAALEWAKKQENNDSTAGDAFYNQVVTGWCDRDLETAAAYVEQHLERSGASDAASTVAAAMFGHDTEAATNWLSRLPTGEARSDAESTIAAMWAPKDPAAAARWLATLPQDEQANLAGTIAGSWIESNWSDASRWIAMLTGGARDQALIVAARREGATSIESLQLALSINDNDTRTRITRSIVLQWAADDRQSAQAWIKNSSLPGEEQQYLLSAIAESQNQNAEVERVIVTH